MNIIETQRLALREFDTQDAAFLCELVNTPEWLRYIGDRNIRNTEDAAVYIEQKLQADYARNGFGFYLVQLRKEGTPIGLCGLVLREGLADVDLGFAFLTRYTGEGYAYESALATLAYAQNFLDLKRVVAISVKDNRKSIQLLQKLGMRFERFVQLPGDEEELMLYAVEREE